MKILAVILLIISLSKICVIFSIERYDLETEIYYSIKNNVSRFHKIWTISLFIDAIIGILCALFLL